MNRSGDKDELLALLRKLRKEIPNLVIRTTFIAGFPGETEEEFTELCEFIKEAKFERMGCFPYSIEEGTPAATFPNQIDEDVKNHRAEIVMDQQSYIMDEFLQNQIGKEMEVVCEGYDRYAECYFGRMKTNRLLENFIKLKSPTLLTVHLLVKLFNRID